MSRTLDLTGEVPKASCGAGGREEAWIAGLLLFATAATGMAPLPVGFGTSFFSPHGKPSAVAPGGPSGKGRVELHVDTTKTFYHVGGSSRQDLWKEIKRKAPVHESRVAVGLTSWHVRWKIDQERSSDGTCQIGRAQIRVEVEIILPRWESPSGAPAALRRQWKSYYSALVRHERRHQTLVIGAGKRPRRAFQGLQASSCAALKQKTNRNGRQIVKRTKARNEHFDRRDDPSL